MFNNVLELWSVIGTLSFAAFGVSKAWEVCGDKTLFRNKFKFVVGAFFGGLFVSWGGGAFGRDMLVRKLRFHEVNAFNPDNITLFTITVVFNISLIALILAFQKHSGKQAVKKVCSILQFLRWHGDSLGCIAFGIISFDIVYRGIHVDGLPLIPMIGAWITVCGGGIIAAFSRAFYKDGRFTEKIMYFPLVLRTTYPYYILGCVITVTYAFLTMLGICSEVATLIITPIGLSVGVWAEKIIIKINTKIKKERDRNEK